MQSSRANRAVDSLPQQTPNDVFLALPPELEGVLPEPGRPPGATLRLGVALALAHTTGTLAGLES